MIVIQIVPADELDAYRLLRAKVIHEAKTWNWTNKARTRLRHINSGGYIDVGNAKGVCAARVHPSEPKDQFFLVEKFVGRLVAWFSGQLVALNMQFVTDVGVDFATADGTAHAGTDYTATSGNLVIPAGQTAAQVKVPVLGNTVAQPDRGLAFTLDNAAGAPLAFGVVGGTIVDDDALRNLIRFDSEEGEYIGAGKHFVLRPPLDGVISTLGEANDLEVRFNGRSWWFLHFSPPAGRTLTVGAFEGATQWPVQPPTTPGIGIYGDGRGCYSTGRFDVLQADYGPSGEVQALAIDAEQHCNGSPPALFVSIRINSTIPVVKRPAPPVLAIAFGAADIPLGGTTSLTFTVTNPNPQDVLTGIAVADALPAGLVVSTPSGVSGTCGGGTITAAPGSGSIALAGATVLMSGSCTFSVNVTGAVAGFKTNNASVTSAETPPGRTATANLKVGLPPPFLFFASDPGDPVGLGQTFTLTTADGTIAATGSQAGGATVQFGTPGIGRWWYLTFASPSGVPFVPGPFEGATRWPFQSPTRPGLDVSGEGRGCNDLTGRFLVLEAQFGPAGEAQVLAIDYEQHCGGGASAVFGAVRYNSLLPVVPRLSVSKRRTRRRPAERPSEKSVKGYQAGRTRRLTRILGSTGSGAGSCPIPAKRRRRSGASLLPPASSDFSAWRGMRQRLSRSTRWRMASSTSSSTGCPRRSRSCGRGRPWRLRAGNAF